MYTEIRILASHVNGEQISSEPRIRRSDRYGIPKKETNVLKQTQVNYSIF